MISVSYSLWPRGLMDKAPDFGGRDPKDIRRLWVRVPSRSIFFFWIDGFCFIFFLYFFLPQCGINAGLPGSFTVRRRRTYCAVIIRVL